MTRTQSALLCLLVLALYGLAMGWAIANCF